MRTLHADCIDWLFAKSITALEVPVRNHVTPSQLIGLHDSNVWGLEHVCVLRLFLYA